MVVGCGPPVGAVVMVARHRGVVPGATVVGRRRRLAVGVVVRGDVRVDVLPDPRAEAAMARAAAERASETVAAVWRTASATPAAPRMPSVAHGTSCQGLCQ